MKLPNSNRKPRGFKADRSMSYYEIEGHALNARRQFAPDVPLDQPTLGVELFENLDHWTVATNAGSKRVTYGVDELPLGTEARTRFDKTADNIVVELSEQTYADLERGRGRARHTLHHEIGHLVMHKDQVIRISEIPHSLAALERSTTHKFYQDTEWQADSFSAAFAMPAKGLVAIEVKHGMLSPQLVSSIMRVSLEAAANRLNTFNSRRETLLRAA
jgi:hypothetical protein